MTRSITVNPEEGYFGFIVKYCSERIALPGFSCSIEQVNELAAPLLDMGCTGWQVTLVLEMIHNRKEGVVGEEYSLEYDPEDDTDGDLPSD